MVYVFIAVVILLIIGPIIAVLPSRRQKEQMALRKRAMAEGISIEFTRIDDPDPDPEKYRSNTGKPLERVMSVVAYRSIRPTREEWRRIPRIDWCAVRRADSAAPDLPAGWAWENELPARMSNELIAFIANELQKLPNDVVRVDEVRNVISVYWQERGVEQELNLIIQFLKGCAGITPWIPLPDSDENDDPSE